MAFNVCVRLGMVQARIWEVLGNAPIHETPAKDTHPPIEADEALAALISEVRNSGHTLVRRFRGKFLGLACKRCQLFRRNAEFNKWRKKCVPKPIPRQIVQEQD